MTRLPTASRLHRALLCPASAVLPVVESKSDAADRGTALHRYLVEVSAFDESSNGALARVPEQWREAAQELDEHAAQLVGYDAERSYSWNPKDGAGMYLGENRDYSRAMDGEFCGTVDYIRIADGVVTVIDLKTGMEDPPPPERNAQMRFLALAACRAHGVESARVGLLRTPEGRRPWWQWGELDAFALAEVGAELRGLVADVEEAKSALSFGKVPRLTTGSHCARCPARLHCPATTAMVRRMAEAPQAVGQDILAMLTPETAAVAYERLRAVEAVLSDVKGALYAFASSNPIALGGGRMFGPVSKMVEKLDGAAVYGVLSGLALTPTEMAEAVSFDATKASLGRAAGLIAKRLDVTRKDALADIMGRIRSAGAVEKKSRTEIREHNATTTQEEE